MTTIPKCDFCEKQSVMFVYSGDQDVYGCEDHKIEAKDYEMNPVTQKYVRNVTGRPFKWQKEIEGYTPARISEREHHYGEGEQ